MASVTITVPKEYGYVLATTAASFLISVWHGVRVGPYRKAAKIPHPTAYASVESIAAATDGKDKEAKYLFNCAQRAHYNFMENYPIALAGLLITGVKYPIASSVTGVVWLASRIAYAIGYTDASKPNGMGRLSVAKIGAYFWLCQLTWVGLMGKAGYDLLTY